MKHKFNLEGYNYRLRPIKLSDAEFIVEVRLEDMNRNRFIHQISPDVQSQISWLENYFMRNGDYYFVVENRLTGNAEGLISIYDENDGCAEWGRWVIKKGSLAAAESVYLLYKIAFEQIGLKELYCRTIEDNKQVVSFHTSIGEKTRKVIKNYTELNGIFYNAVEQYSDKENFYNNISPRLEKQAQMILTRNQKNLIGKLNFHHIGVAVKNIDKEFTNYALLGYRKDGKCFVDEEQGVKGLFIYAKGQPTLELLENLPEFHTLDLQLKNGQKMYHMAYYTSEFDKTIDMFEKCRAKIILPPKQSVYFKKRICFLMLNNMAMIELLEKNIY